MLQIDIRQAVPKIVRSTLLYNVLPFILINILPHCWDWVMLQKSIDIRQAVSKIVHSTLLYNVLPFILIEILPHCWDWVMLQKSIMLQK